MTFIIVYQDNILILTSGSFDDHLWQLGTVFKWLHHNNLQVNTKKSSFCALETEYLGFILTREDIKLQQQKVIRMLNHYKAMIPHCSHLLAPLTALTKKNIKFQWTKEHLQAFNSL
jgi:hypothetical protein